ncbi:MAG: hypothetical protein U0793_33400 [Gemmataceae bacterium]
MARSRSNGHAKLDEALANLIQNQAILVQNQVAFVAEKAAMDKELAEIRKRMETTDRENCERFARIEALLLEHNRMLTALPDQLREEIGFKAPPS